MPTKEENPFLSPEGVARIARLARLRVPEIELPIWAAQMKKIVGYVDLLAEIPEKELPEIAPPPATPFRADEALAGDGAAELSANARRTAHGHVVVPRVVDPL